MERNLNLIRAIMLEIEALDDDNASGLRLADLKCANQLGVSVDAVVYQIKLMGDVGWISLDYHDKDKDTFCFERLTFQGHDILDQIRDEERWKSVQKMVRCYSFDQILETLSAHRDRPIMLSKEKTVTVRDDLQSITADKAFLTE